MINATSATSTTLEIVQQLEAAFNRHDVDAQLACLTADCVFEIVAPPDKNGGRFEGQAAIRSFWSQLPNIFPGYAFSTEDIFAAGERCCYRWVLRFRLPDGQQAAIRGIDAYTVRDGKISAKYTYFTA